MKNALLPPLLPLRENERFIETFQMGQIGPYVGNGLYWVWKESCLARNSGQYHPQKGLTCNYDIVSKNQTLVVIDNSRPARIHWIIAMFLLSNMTIWSHIVLHNRLDLLEFDNIFAFNPAFGGCRATLCLYLLQQFWRAAAKVFFAQVDTLCIWPRKL